MLSMSEIKCIRFLRQKKGKSINEIAELLGRDWDTVEKYGDSERLPMPKKRKRKRPKIGDYEETIKGWLTEDLLKKKKQRRNAAAIHEQLKQLGYDGSPRTTRHWVSKWKKQIVASSETAHIRLEHPPGEAQVDLFDVWVVDANRDCQLRKMHMLEMSFPYSSGCLGVLIPAENIECILQGLTWLFEELGGVPPVLIFDNLKPVVKKVLFRGKRVLTDAFERFKYYYRFEAKFCNPASGHEKGSTECKGGYIPQCFPFHCPPKSFFVNFNSINTTIFYQSGL
jgi:transposase